MELSPETEMAMHALGWGDEKAVSLGPAFFILFILTQDLFDTLLA